MNEADHNIMGMAGEEFDRHVARIARAKIALDEARTAVKGARNAFKASGGVLGDLDDMIRLRDLGHEEAMSTFQRRAAYARRLGTLPRATQLEMFDGVTVDPAADRARDEGKWAGLTGKPVGECPHDENLPQGQAWIEGWHAGAEIFQKAADDEALAEINARDAGVDVMNDPDPEEDDDGPDIPEEDAKFLGEIDEDADAEVRAAG